MYVIKSWTRDFRDEETRRGDYSCYREIEYKRTGEYFLGIPLRKPVGKKGTFINDRIISTKSFKRLGLRFHLYLLKMKFCEDFIETAYIPESIDEYNYLNNIAIDVMRGKYKNEPDRSNLLREDGFDPYKVQSFVNYKLDCYDLFVKEDFERSFI